MDRLVTSGTFTLDGETTAVDTNVWVVGDEHECVVIDAAHDAEAISLVVGERRLVAVISTHGHDDHVDAAPALADAHEAPVLLHPADRVLWDMRHPDRPPDADLLDGKVVEVAGVRLEVLHTPGHSPGACCLHDAAGGALYSGDTLLRGGPGATGRSYSDFDTIIASIRDRLLVLPPETVVRTGHGGTTTIGDETGDLDDWTARGH